MSVFNRVTLLVQLFVSEYTTSASSNIFISSIGQRMSTLVNVLYNAQIQTKFHHHSSCICNYYVGSIVNRALSSLEQYERLIDLMQEYSRHRITMRIFSEI